MTRPGAAHPLRAAPTVVRCGEVSVLVYGAGAVAWPGPRSARWPGAAGRIGREDIRLLPDGTRAASTAERVRAARSGSV